MSLERRGAAGALQALGADDGPGGRAGHVLMAMCAEVLSDSAIHPIAKLVFVGIIITLEFIKWWIGRKRVPQCKLIEGVPEEGGIAYKQQVVRYTHQPYTFTYSHPTGTITGIACIPVDEQTQSPEAEVIKGGVNHNYATICLTPPEKGKWACDVAICIKLSSATPTKEADSTTHAAAPPAGTTHAAAPPAGTAHAAAPPAGTTHAAAPPTKTTPAADPAVILHWLVALVVVMFFVIVILMIVIVVRA